MPTVVSVVYFISTFLSIYFFTLIYQTVIHYINHESSYKVHINRLVFAVLATAVIWFTASSEQSEPPIKETNSAVKTIPISFLRFDRPSGMYQFGSEQELIGIPQERITYILLINEESTPSYFHTQDGGFGLAINCRLKSPVFPCTWLETESTGDDESLDTAQQVW